MNANTVLFVKSVNGSCPQEGGLKRSKVALDRCNQVVNGSCPQEGGLKLEHRLDHGSRPYVNDSRPQEGGLHAEWPGSTNHSMNDPDLYPLSGLPTALATAELCHSIEDLAAHWACQEFVWRLQGLGASAPVGLGAHIRRSFLGALGRSASQAAAAGMPCNWDPPCGFDVFKREQMRGVKGDGLPKPYVIAVDFSGDDLLVSLRVFGMANDWAASAADAMVVGLRDILPWHFIYPGRTSPPTISDRIIHWPELVLPNADHEIDVLLGSPMDVSKSNPFADPVGILTRLLRRIDGLSRWNGCGLTQEAGRSLALAIRGNVFVDPTGLERQSYSSPNAAGQIRQNSVVKGHFIVSGDLALVSALVAMGLHCHAGRGAVEGLGQLQVRS